MHRANEVARLGGVPVVPPERREVAVLSFLLAGVIIAHQARGFVIADGAMWAGASHWGRPAIASWSRSVYFELCVEEQIVGPQRSFRRVPRGHERQDQAAGMCGDYSEGAGPTAVPAVPETCRHRWKGRRALR